MYAIVHLQAQHSGTWYWAVHFSRRGRLYSRRFYEPKYGGKANARRAAIAWRDEQLAKAQALSLLDFCQQKRSNNTSGVAGVHFLKPASQPEGIWQAKLKLGGKYVSKSFSVQKHGDRQAYELAIAAREQMLASTPDRPYVYDTVAKRFATVATSTK